MIFNITLLLLAFLLFHTLPKIPLSKFRKNPQSTRTQQLEIPRETNQQFISRRLREIDQLRNTPVTDQQFIRNRLREIDNHFRIAHRNLIDLYYSRDENNNRRY